jgi:leucyl aminopeptidase
MQISFCEFKPPQSGAVVVGVWEGGDLTAPARQLDELTAGAVSRALAASPKFRGQRSELVPVVAPANLSVSRIVLAGLGKPDSLSERGLEDLGGSLVAHLNGAGETEATIAIDPGDAAAVSPAKAAAHLALGAALRAYRFDKYRTTEKPERKPSLATVNIAAGLRAGQHHLSRDAGRAGREFVVAGGRGRHPR